MPLSTRDLDRLKGCDPAFVAKLTQLFEAMEARDHDLFVVEGFRSQARQVALYAQGRTTTGHIVTNCDGVATKSSHQSGLAADVAFATETPFDNKNPWTLLGETAEGLGLRWGGRFKLVDLDHVEMPPVAAKGA